MICLLRVTTHATHCNAGTRHVFSALAEPKAKEDCSTLQMEQDPASWHLKENVRHKQKRSLTIQKIQSTFRWDVCSWKVWGNLKIDLSRFWRYRMCHCSISAFCLSFFLRLKRCWFNWTISFPVWCWMLYSLLPKMFKTNYIQDGLVCKGGGCFLLKFLHILVGSALTNEVPGDLEGRPLEERLRTTRWGRLTHMSCQSENKQLVDLRRLGMPFIFLAKL